MQNRKVRVFLLFLACSSMAWLVSNLSEYYISNAIFTLEYTASPDSLLLNKVSKNKIEVKLRASGFQFLGFGLKKKKVILNMNTVSFRRGKYFVTPRIYKSQIEKQLSSSVELMDIDNDTIFFDFSKVLSKEITVEPRVEVQLTQNYLMENGLEVSPKTITVNGPTNEIDTITSIQTAPLQLTGVSENFTREIPIVISPSLKHTRFSVDKVTISGKVAKFSEKIVDVPVTVTNVPNGMSVRVFPNKVSVLCKASLTALKKLKPSDFYLTVDYKEINDSLNTLPIKISKKPNNLYSAHLLEVSVEYILNTD